MSIKQNRSLNKRKNNIYKFTKRKKEKINKFKKHVIGCTLNISSCCRLILITLYKKNNLKDFILV